MAGICLASALWFGCLLCDTYIGYREGEKDLRKLYEQKEQIEKQIEESIKEQAEKMPGESAKESTGEPAEKPVGEPTEEWSGEPTGEQIVCRLKEINADVAGWIQIDGTPINYPVMHTPQDPDFYLSHGFDKKSSIYGMIYMDAGCSPDKDGMNYLLYGHHMKNGSMFASLKRYQSEEYCKKNPQIRFDLTDSCGKWEIFAVLRISAADLTREKNKMLAAGTRESYQALMEYVEENRLYDTGGLPQWPQKLLTLVTCEYTEKDGRLFVFARRLP